MTLLFPISPLPRPNISINIKARFGFTIWSYLPWQHETDGCYSDDNARTVTWPQRSVEKRKNISMHVYIYVQDICMQVSMILHYYVRVYISVCIIYLCKHA